MAGWIEFLRYQTIAYWRRAFAVRGKYDSGAGFLFLILLGFAYGYVSILRNAAKSVESGNAENLNLVWGIVFFAWIFPVLESQTISAKTIKFLHLPLTKNQFALINLASVFLLPTTIISVLISFAAIYPLAFSANIFVAVFSLFIFVLCSAFLFAGFFNLLKFRLFRKIAFTTAVMFAVIFFAGKINVFADCGVFTNKFTAEIIHSDNQFADVFSLCIFFFTTFIFAFTTARQTIYASATRHEKPNSLFFSRFHLPLKFGELIKKDVLYSWKILDYYFSLLMAIFYALVLIFTEFSFQSFGVAISLTVMMSGSLAFNNFGLETASAIERLSLLPITAEDLMAVKNKAFAIVIFSQIFFWFPLLFFKFGMILTLAAVLKTVSIVLLYTAWGNYLSVKFPFKMRFYQLSFGGSIPAMLYGVLTISLFIVAPEFFTAEQITAKIIFNIFSVVVCFLIYKFSLRRISRRLFADWENIALKLS